MEPHALHLTQHQIAGERIEADAWFDMYEAARATGLTRVARFGPIVARALPALAPVVPMNGALGVSLSASTDDIAAAVAWLDEQRVHYYLSIAEPESVQTWLSANGFEPGYAWMKFHRSLDAAAPIALPTELDVRIATRDEADAFGSTVVAGFGMSPDIAPLASALVGRDGWTCFVAWDGDEPAGAGALFVSDDGAWLGMGATRAEHRRKGAQGAILAARLQHARALGCADAYTETGELQDGEPAGSYRNILRAGFAECYRRPNYQRVRSAD